MLGDGRWHSLYELRLANYSSHEITLEKVEVVDARTDELLAELEGQPLLGMIVSPGANASKPELIKAGGFALLYFHTAAPASAQWPTALVHRFRFKPTPLDRSAEDAVIVTKPILLERAAPVLDPPLRGEGWVAANILSNTAGHRRAVAVVDGQARIAQRYAIDFVHLDADGRAFVGDPKLNENWSGYGAEVLAVADGRVAAVRNGMPDAGPGVVQPPITGETVGGNSVVLEIGDGRYAFYAHLQPEGIRVKEGQRVRMGEVLGLLGNSGQSDAPHLHFHVSDDVTSLGANGLAYRFEAFDLLGYVPSVAVIESAEGWTGRGGGQRARKRRELPVNKAVVAFPD